MNFSYCCSNSPVETFLWKETMQFFNLKVNTSITCSDKVRFKAFAFWLDSSFRLLTSFSSQNLLVRRLFLSWNAIRKNVETLDTTFSFPNPLLWQFRILFSIIVVVSYVAFKPAIFHNDNWKVKVKRKSYHPVFIVATFF